MSTADINPYAPPQVDDRQMPLGVGAWRDGELLVLHPRADLPRFCVETGEAAAGTRDYPVVWKRPGSLLSSSAHFAMPLRRDRLYAFARLRRKSIIGILLAACAIATTYVWPMADVLGDSILLFAPGVILLGLAGIALWFAAASAITKPLEVVYSKGDYLWLRGAHVAFLARLPPWPGTHQ